MREILFRGKHTKTGKWAYGLLWHHTEVSASSLIYSDELDTKVWVHSETVGQYTGLTDKNGKKIFEGDIVEGADFTAEDGGYGVVSFVDGAFEVNGNNVTGTFHENYYGREFEVIGNIYDNPELLEVSEDG